MPSSVTRTRIPIQTKIRATFFAGLMIVLVIAGFSYWSIRGLFAAAERKTRAHAVRDELQDVLVRLDEAETGQRAYVITGEDRYLTPYGTAVATIPREMQDVYDLLDDDPEQARRVKEIEPVLRERLDRLQEGVHLRQTSGFEAAADLVRSGRGLDLMERFRAGVGQIRAAAEAHSAEQDAAFRQRIVETLGVIGAGGFLAIIVIGAANIVIQRELAARARAEATRRELAAIVESSTDAIIGTTVDGIITSWNRGAERLFGYPAEEVIGRSRSILVPPERADEVPATIEVLRRAEIVPHFETERVRRDGSRVDVSMTYSPISDGAGRIVGASAIARDITDRKDLERQRADFLAMITHDIRGPLALIYGYLDLLDTGGRLTAEDKDLVRATEGVAETILALLNDHLDLSKIEAGRLTLTRCPTSLPDVVQNVARQLGHAITRRGITLDCRSEPDVPLVDGDPVALERIVFNLAYNAIKYLPDGGTLVVRSLRHGAMAAVEVADNGPGMSAEELPLIFERYQQAATGRLKKGTGLGLFIVKSLAEAHGGRVLVESTPGQGTCFRVLLPTSAS